MKKKRLPSFTAKEVSKTPGLGPVPSVDVRIWLQEQQKDGSYQLDTDRQAHRGLEHKFTD